MSCGRERTPDAQRRYSGVMATSRRATTRWGSSTRGMTPWMKMKTAMTSLGISFSSTCRNEFSFSIERPMG